MDLLSKTEILKAQPPTAEVECSKLGGLVRVRALGVDEWDDLEPEVIEGRASRLRSRVLALCIIDEHGGRVFGDADVEAIGRLDSMAVQPAYRKIMQLSGLSNDAVEELVGNSDGGLGAASSTESPKP